MPRLLTRNIEGIQNNRHFMLCPTHHKCYDTFKLNKEEVATLKPYIEEALSMTIDIARAIAPATKKHQAAFALSQERIKIWVGRMYEVFYG